MTSPPSAPTLRVRDLTKRFGEVVANDGVSLDAWPGEVHCLLGENGAGKSTLIAMLAGLQQPDSGMIELDGTAATISAPAVALGKGIAIVYQHSALIPSMTVLENLMLGQSEGLLLDRAQARARLADLEVTLGASLNPDARVSELGLGQQQQIEIAKATWGGTPPRVLVLDEPTSMLSRRGVEQLEASIRALTAQGVAVILVTHKLDEALALGDRVTVLREGRVVRRFEAAELKSGDEDRARVSILDAMFGGALVAAPAVALAQSGVPQRGSAPAKSSSFDSASPEVLRLEHVSTSTGEGTPLADVSLSVRGGEVLGIAGIDGHGQRHLAEIVAGQRVPVSGRVLLDGDDITGSSVRERQRLGVRYVTDDRLHEGIVGSFSVALNLLLKRIGERPFWRFGRENREAVNAHAAGLIEQYGIRASSAATPAGTLSGGNIQKILLARELENEPRVVVFNKPSYGLDLKTVRLVHEQIRSLAAAGTAVLLISTDLDELVELADNIAVISAGRIVGQVENHGRARERIGELIAGGAVS